MKKMEKEKKVNCGIDGGKDTFMLKPSLFCCLIVAGQLITKKEKGVCLFKRRLGTAPVPVGSQVL